MTGLATDSIQPGDSIPDTDHVTHHCRPFVYPDGQFAAAAFLPRAAEPYLSLNWIEFFRAAEDPIECIRCALGKKLGLSSSGCIAQFNVGEAQRAFQRMNVISGVDAARARPALSITYEPELEEPEDLSHAGARPSSNQPRHSELNERMAAAIRSVVSRRYPPRHPSNTP